MSAACQDRRSHAIDATRSAAHHVLIARRLHPCKFARKWLLPPLLTRAGLCATRLPTMFRFLLSFLIGKFIGDFIFGALLRSKLLRRLTVVAIIGTYVWAKYW